MSKLLITTQVYENYGAHDWDGEGECPQYWKAKGGSEYVVKNIDVSRVDELMLSVWNQVECANEYYRETILGHEVVADDYLTEFERSQLEYEGSIRYPAKELEIV
jgi:hypothetical protein